MLVFSALLVQYRLHQRGPAGRANHTEGFASSARRRASAPRHSGVSLHRTASSETAARRHGSHAVRAHRARLRLWENRAGRQRSDTPARGRPRTDGADGGGGRGSELEVDEAKAASRRACLSTRRGARARGDERSGDHTCHEPPQGHVGETPQPPAALLNQSRTAMLRPSIKMTSPPVGGADGRTGKARTSWMRRRRVGALRPILRSKRSERTRCSNSGSSGH